MGHIHLGYENIKVPFNGNIFTYDVDEQRSEIVKVLDLFVSVPSVLMEPDNKRKELYGKAGAFRPKPYGLEYRTPSNWYLANNKLKRWMFDSVKKAIEFFNENGQLENNLANYICQTINNNDKDAAKVLINKFNLKTV